MQDLCSAIELSDSIGGIYDCALDPALWPGVLAGLCRQMDFRMSSLILAAMPGARPLLDITTGVTAEERARMLAHSDAAVEAWGPPGTLATLPLEVPLIRSAVNPAASASRYVRDHCLPLGFFDNMSIMFTRDSASFSVLSFGRHVDAGPIGDREVATARLFVPHLKRAVTISRLLEVKTLRAANFASVLEGLSVGVLLVDAGMRLVHANAAAERALATGAPLGVKSGVVVATSGVAAALGVAVARSAGEGSRIGARGLGVPARDRDGVEVVLHVLPLGSGDVRAPILPGAVAAIFVAPAVAPRRVPMEAVAALFDLTPAEARVLEHVAAGRTSAETAAALGIEVSTVRTHLLRLYDKTGTGRQADLVALLASFALPLG